MRTIGLPFRWLNVAGNFIWPPYEFSHRIRVSVRFCFQTGSLFRGHPLYHSWRQFDFWFPNHCFWNMSGQSITDRIAAAQHSMTGSAISKAVCKATTHEVSGPKKKHLDCRLSTPPVHRRCYILATKALVTLNIQDDLYLSLCTSCLVWPRVYRNDSIGQWIIAHHRLQQLSSQSLSYSVIILR